MPRNAPNRTDLLAPKAADNPAAGQPNGQPIRVPTNLPYGENQALTQDQQSQPLPNATPPPAPAGPPAQGGGLQGAVNAAQQFQMPTLPDLERPTERPNEPVTAGLPSGPGPGAPQNSPMADLLDPMASASISPALRSLAQRARAYGQ